MKPTRTHLRCLAVLVGALVLLAPLPAAAAVSAGNDNVACWKRLLNDWYDGTIDKIYPIPCYAEAIKHLPQEIEIYGSAKEDILAARQAAINNQPAPPEKSSSTTAATTTTAGASQTPPSTTTTTAAVTTTTTTETTNGTTTTKAVVVVVPSQTTPPKKKGGISGALADITPGDPQAFPLPLLILGALAILLVAAGVAGMLWQRSHPRDDGPAAT